MKNLRLQLILSLFLSILFYTFIDPSIISAAITEEHFPQKAMAGDGWRDYAFYTKGLDGKYSICTAYGFGVCAATWDFAGFPEVPAGSSVKQVKIKTYAGTSGNSGQFLVGVEGQNCNATNFLWANDITTYVLPKCNYDLYFTPNIRNNFSIQNKPVSAGAQSINLDAISVSVEYDSPTPTPTAPPSPTPTPTPSAPEPFLDLPWNYDCRQAFEQALNEECESKREEGKFEKSNFTQALFNINSWFDHQYPLQNFNCCIESTLTFLGGERKLVDYKSHSGYDYGALAGVKLHTPVLAAAGGIAEFKSANRSSGAGNIIKIDHGNGYQTWYEHLDVNNLIVAKEGEKKMVVKGQKIGEVGLTGNTTGAHIHLSVFKDNNDNGNFDDDYPYGLVDPLGWEGDYDDPWTKYTQDPPEKEAKRYGSASYNLYAKRVAAKTQQISKGGGTLNTEDEKIRIEVPEGATNSAFTLSHEYGPFESFEDNGKFFQSIMPSFFLEALSGIDEKITLFQKPLKIVLSYSALDAFYIKENTLFLYYFDEFLQAWVPLPSIVDEVTRTLTAFTTHNSHFALMGEAKDKIPPSAVIIVNGEKGEDNWYRSEVVVELNSQDNDGGVGLEYTLFTLDNNHWEIYTTPLIFEKEGIYEITYQAFDKAGNEGERKTVSFKIDKTLPAVHMQVSPDILWPPDGRMMDVEVSGEINDMNMRKTTFAVIDEYGLIEPVITQFGQTIQLEAKRNGSDKDGRIYTIRSIAEDLAGNRTIAEAIVTVPHDQKN